MTDVIPRGKAMLKIRDSMFSIVSGRREDGESTVRVTFNNTHWVEAGSVHNKKSSKIADREFPKISPKRSYANGSSI